MNIIQLRDLYRQSESLADQTITICGWVRSNRDSKSFGFLSIHDGTFFQPVQVVYDDKLANYDIVRKINVGTALIISGQLLLTPEAKQPFEIHASGIEVEGDCPGDYPLQKSGTVSNIFEPYHIYAPGPTHFRLCSASVL